MGNNVWAPMRHAAALVGMLVLVGCGNSHTDNERISAASPAAPERSATEIEADRKAILAMAGDYKVTFDFQETVSFQEGYTPKERYKTGAHEMVRVIEDTGTYISLQHILVVGDGEKMPLMPIKHWRQDWVYEPTEVIDFIGANTWQKRRLSENDRTGKWAQVVYQVDDAPRYAGVAAWDHTNGVSRWSSPPSWRPLPRRDATKRDDYHAIIAVNRHAITPEGWVHEQDNAKLILTGDKPQVLVHEIGVNTYRHYTGFNTEIGTEYWEATEGFWAKIRDEWSTLFAANDTVALTVLGEPSEVYMQILGIAADVADGKAEENIAADEALAILRDYITTSPAAVVTRLRQHDAQTSVETYGR